MDDAVQLIPEDRSAFLPRAMVDVGDSPWAVVSGIVARRLDEMRPDDILEVSSLEPGHRHHLMTWCDATGHDLYQIVVEGVRTWFWIKKR